MTANETIFRAHKRKKTLKRRPEDNDEPHFDIPQALQHHQPIVPIDRIVEDEGQIKFPDAGAVVATETDEETSISEIIRRRRMMQPRRGGIEFSNVAYAQRPTTNTMDRATLAVVDKPNALELAAKRFAPQTGQLTQSTDQHMMAFIDSEMEKFRTGHSNPENDEHTASANMFTAFRSGVALPQRQPAALGQIQEIDLGPDAALRNAARTEAAARKMQGGQIAVEDVPAGKIRLGRDGKPRRRRNRRGSDDVKRDQIVEAVLKESKLDLYDELGAANQIDEGDQAADDIIAEQFRRDFLDAVQSRNHVRRSAASQAAKKAGKVEDKPKGPKLGGSRSARAAMHAQEKAAGKKR